MTRIYFLLASLLGVALLCWNCQPTASSHSAEKLPYLGFHQVDETTGDTIYHQIRDFAFIDQDSQLITNEYFAGKAYVADFFFTSCPTICPKVKQQMLRIYDRYRDDDRLLLLSHTIDVKRDTVPKLKRYAQGLGVDSPKWRFVTG
ncbi:MAG: SCO family protein, partial [Bacteroidetes bacterium]